jgi:hypothetical protein
VSEKQRAILRGATTCKGAMPASDLALQSSAERSPSWSRAPHWKCGKRGNSLRGFESLSLRISLINKVIERSYESRFSGWQGRGRHCRVPIATVGVRSLANRPRPQDVRIRRGKSGMGRWAGAEHGGRRVVDSDRPNPAHRAACLAAPARLFSLRSLGSVGTDQPRDADRCRFGPQGQADLPNFFGPRDAAYGSEPTSRSGQEGSVLHTPGRTVIRAGSQNRDPFTRCLDPIVRFSREAGWGRR